jgi:flagellar biosynthesis component FlhA
MKKDCAFMGSLMDDEAQKA